MFAELVETFAAQSKTVFEQMTGIGVMSAKYIRVPKGFGTLPLAQVIGYKSEELGIEGNFVLGFPKPKMALAVATALAVKMGVEKPKELDADALDLLGEFMNTVVGRAISAWDRMGVSVEFGAPSTLAKTSMAKVGDGPDTENFTVILNLAFSHLLFNLAFAKPSPASCPAAPKRILVADDSNILRKVLAKTLSQAGYDVAQAEDGQVAVEMVRSFRPQVAVMDLVMPNMGGLDSIMAIREFDREVRFLVLTSSDRTDEVVTAKTLGVMDYLLKPVDQDRLLSAVSAAFEGRPAC